MLYQYNIKYYLFFLFFPNVTENSLNNAIRPFKNALKH